jgi:hypothetical protein
MPIPPPAVLQTKWSAPSSSQAVDDELSVLPPVHLVPGEIAEVVPREDGEDDRAGLEQVDLVFDPEAELVRPVPAGACVEDLHTRHPAGRQHLLQLRGEGLGKRRVAGIDERVPVDRNPDAARRQVRLLAAVAQRVGLAEHPLTAVGRRAREPGARVRRRLVDVALVENVGRSLHRQEDPGHQLGCDQGDHARSHEEKNGLHAVLRSAHPITFAMRGSIVADLPGQKT